MPDLVSLERKRENFDSAVEVSKSYFPHSMYLDGDEISDLGLGGVELGNERMMVVKVRVTSMSSDEREGEKKNKSLTLDLIEAAVAPEGKSKANRIFGDDNGNDK
jgi:hypothetical protein|tara:strand:- start:3526 stop:3840 length:315 start_codon:yes stop_codon:yes gene_type:complete